MTDSGSWWGIALQRPVSLGANVKLEDIVCVRTTRWPRREVLEARLSNVMVRWRQHSDTLAGGWQNASDWKDEPLRLDGWAIFGLASAYRARTFIFGGVQSQ